MAKSNMNAVESGRAAHAYEAVKRGMPEEEKYAESAKKLPMLIKVNGLVPALLFAKEKKQFGKDEASLEHSVLSWLNEDGCPVSQIVKPKVGKDIGKLTELESRQYRQVTAEVQRYLNWVKRFSAAQRAGKKEAK